VLVSAMITERWPGCGLISARARACPRVSGARPRVPGRARACPRVSGRVVRRARLRTLTPGSGTVGLFRGWPGSPTARRGSGWLRWAGTAPVTWCFCPSW